MSSIADVQLNLRKVRKSKGFTLKEVEALSNGLHKAVVIGSYERGSRSISVDKLITLSEFYEVPVSEFFGGSNTDKKAEALIDLLREVLLSNKE
jgi:transcriptional regulator with XRE-family HTH domain